MAPASGITSTWWIWPKGIWRRWRRSPTFRGAVAINLGTGRGHSVLEMVKAMEAVVGRPLPHRAVARRPGDIASCYASAELAATRLGWRARRSLGEMCVDAWRWQSDNPEGYPQPPR